MPDEGLPFEMRTADTAAADPVAAAQRQQTYLLLGIYLLLACFALFMARGLILPILVAVLFKLVLAPLVKLLNRAYLPDAVGAAIVLTLLTCGITYGAYALSAPAAEWVKRVPERLWILRAHLQTFEETLDYVREAGKSVSQLSKMADPTQEPATAGSTPAAPPTVVSNGAGVGSIVLSETANATLSIGSMLVLLYFLLASGDMFLRKLVTALPTFRDKKQAVEIARQVQNDVSHYLLTVTIINAALGIIVGIVLLVIGMPSPWLWGAMVGILNFIPFIGPATFLAVIALVSFMSFPDWHTAILPPLAVLGICTLEGQFVTPTIVARRLVLNPVAVFIALLVCGWTWGIVGVLLSVPLLVVFKILCDRVKPLMPIGEFLGR